MKKGICFTYEEGASLETQFKKYKEAGFDGIELTLGQSYLRLDNLKKDAEKAAEAAKKVEIELPSIRWGMFGKYSLTTSEIENQKKAIEVVEKGIKICSFIGARVLLVVPGEVEKEVSYEIVYERAFRVIKELAFLAEEEKVFLALENVENKFLLSPLEMRDFIDKIGSEYVKVYFDVGNIPFCGLGYPEQWIKILNNRIKKVHIKDYSPKTGITSLLKGEIDWLEVMKSLENIGYDDYLTVELPHSHQELPRILRDVQKIINKEV